MTPNNARSADVSSISGYERMPRIWTNRSAADGCLTANAARRLVIVGARLAGGLRCACSCSENHCANHRTAARHAGAVPITRRPDPPDAHRTGVARCTYRRPHALWQRATGGTRLPGSVPGLLIRELRQDLVDAQAVRLLTRWKFFEGREELPDNLLGRQEGPQLVGHPAQVHPRFEGEPLERILPDVDDHGPGRRLAIGLGDIPFHQAEVDLPVHVADGGQVAASVEVEDFLALAGPLAGQQIGLVVAVEMDLEGPVAHLAALLEALLDVRHACGCQQRREPVLLREDL